MPEHELTVIAEIHLSGDPRAGFLWAIQTPRGRLGCSVPQPTPTEAVWAAVAAMRLFDLQGSILVRSPDRSRCASAPLWAVPSYDQLDWQDSGAPRAE